MTTPKLDTSTLTGKRVLLILDDSPDLTGHDPAILPDVIQLTGLATAIVVAMLSEMLKVIQEETGDAVALTEPGVSTIPYITPAEIAEVYGETPTVQQQVEHDLGFGDVNVDKWRQGTDERLGDQDPTEFSAAVASMVRLDQVYALYRAGKHERVLEVIHQGEQEHAG